MFSALRYSNYRWFWLNGITQAMGQGMQFLVLGFLVLDFTGSSNQLGRVLSIMGLAPAVHYLGALPLAYSAGITSWPIAITGGAAFSLIFALWLGVWRPVLRRLEE